jgi:hypothetical protein
LNAALFANSSKPAMVYMKSTSARRRAKDEIFTNVNQRVFSSMLKDLQYLASLKILIILAVFIKVMIIELSMMAESYFSRKRCTRKISTKVRMTIIESNMFIGCWLMKSFKPNANIFKHISKV